MSSSIAEFTKKRHTDLFPYAFFVLFQNVQSQEMKCIPYTLETFTAWRPFGPSWTSNCTLSPSFRVLYPSPTIDLKCTNTSSPLARETNPNPLALLNHLTVPCSMEQILSYKMFPDQPSGWCTPQLPTLAKKSANRDTNW